MRLSKYAAASVFWLGGELSSRGAVCCELVLQRAGFRRAAFRRSAQSEDQHPDPHGSEMA
jgi:hypothetical protein